MLLLMGGFCYLGYVVWQDHQKLQVVQTQPASTPEPIPQPAATLAFTVAADATPILAAIPEAAVPTPAPTQTPAPTVKELDMQVADDNDFKAAKLAELKEDYVEMLTDAKRLVEHYPQSCLANKCLSDAFGNMKFLDKAFAAIQKAIELNPQDVIAWHDMADILVGQEKLDEALAAINKGIKINDSEPILLVDLAFLFNFWNQNQKSIIYANRTYNLLKASKFNTHSGELREADIWSSLSLIYGCNQKWDMDEVCAKEGIAVETNSPKLWFNLGVAYANQDKYEDAANALNQAVRIKPNYEMAKKYLKDMTASLNLRNQSSKGVVQNTPTQNSDNSDAIDRIAAEQRQMQSQMEIERFNDKFQEQVDKSQRDMEKNQRDNQSELDKLNSNLK